MQFTDEQIRQLAPDPASAAAGKQLANPAKWVTKCSHELALWGDCQGSGKVPYSTVIDLSNLGFKCTCPSRKFPCKHGLGLLFLMAGNKAAFTVSDTLAPHVEDWLSKRNARQTAKEQTEAKPVDEKARQKRADQRTAKVDEGVEALGAWLKDQVRTGLVDAQQQAYQFSSKIAARMVDAQAPALASRLNAINVLDFYRDGWQKSLLKHLAYTYMIANAYRKINDLPEQWQEEIRTLVGWNTSKETLLQTGETLEDRWTVLCVQQENQDKLRVEKVWLWANGAQRFGLLLNFYAPGQIAPQTFLAGTTLAATLVYYPAVSPLRVLVKTIEGTIDTQWPVGASSLEQVLEHCRQQLALNPLQPQVPALLAEVSLRKVQDRWWLVDGQGRALPLRHFDAQALRILAATLGRPFHGMATWEDGQLSLCAYWADNRFFTV